MSSILIVEDEDQLASVLSRKLRDADFEVDTASKVSDAIMVLSKKAFQCILLDLRLEQGSGELVISFVRQDKTGLNYSTPIIVMSALLDKDLVKRIGRDIHSAIVKPFDHETLLARLKKVCEQK